MIKLSGIPAADGIALGRVYVLKDKEIKYNEISSVSPSMEKERFFAALTAFDEKSHIAAQKIKESTGEKESEILLGHIEIAKDNSIKSEIEKYIDSGMTAEAAVNATYEGFAKMLTDTDDELTQERAADLLDIKMGLMRLIRDTDDDIFGGDFSDIPSGSVIAAQDLTPSQTVGMDKTKICGIICTCGGKTSHTAILARALAIPAVLGMGDLLNQVENGSEIVVDGISGDVIINPTESEKEEFKEKAKRFNDEKAKLLEYKNRATMTADGVRYEIFCNIASSDEAESVLNCGGEGVGLMRSEFLYMLSKTLPSEEMQYIAYKNALKCLENRPLIVRTLDIGGDKEIPYMNLKKEENPFLGFRAIRYCLKNPDIFIPQIRALLRAAVHGDIRIMLPLVTSVDEIWEVRKIIKSVADSLKEEGVEHNADVPLGVMIETPAAAIMADKLAEAADFFSIGTNDLTGYTMAVDRGNSDVMYLYSHYNPAVLRMIKYVVDSGKSEGISVGMCGEAAADPLMLPLLISFGIDEISVELQAVLRCKKIIAEYTKSEADRIASTCLSLKTEEEVKKVLSECAAQKV